MSRRDIIAPTHMNRLFKFGLALSFLLRSLAAAEPAAPIQFTNIPSPNVIDFGRAADFNEDGLFDFLAVRRMQFYWNLETNFIVGANYRRSTGSSYHPSAIADFNNDSHLDVFFVRDVTLSSSETTVLWNQGGTVFTNTPRVTFPLLSYGAAEPGDFDNDGDLDLVMFGSTNDITRGRNITRLYENLGGGEFHQHVSSFPGFEDGAASWTDYDNDGDLDLLLTGYTNQSRGASILYRNDAGTFVHSGVALPSFVQDLPVPLKVDWGDFDHDDDLDLLMVGATLQGSNVRGFASIFRNDNQSFTAISFGATNNTGAWIRGNWADLDADGYLDILVSYTSSSKEEVYRNNGDGTFSAPTQLSVSASQFHPGFFDRDQSIDLLAETWDGYLRPLRNNTPITNTPPSLPSNLSSFQIDSSVQFSWERSIDAGRTNGITYNLRVGTTPGRSDVVSAMSNPTNGALYIAQPGNAGLHASRTIHRLAAGTYYWSVQAIDHGFLASEFAPEQTLIVSNASPIVEAVLKNVSATAALIWGRIHPNGAETVYFVEISSSAGTHQSVLLEISGDSHRQNVLVPLTNLAPALEYQARLVASNAFGLSEGAWQSFKTLPSTILTELPTTFRQANLNRMLALDVDRDGDLDVLNSTLSNSTYATSLYINNAGFFTDGIFTNTGTQLLLHSYVYAATDLNNDSRPDLLFDIHDDSYVYLAATNGFKPLIGFTGLHLIVDLDNDGDSDLFAPTDDWNLPRLFHNDGFPKFRSVYLEGGSPFADWGDYDNDGDNDLLMYGFTNSAVSTAPDASATRILGNEGNNRFVDVEAGLPGTWLDATWGDYDNDADLDVFVITGTNTTKYTTTTIELFRNDGPLGFTRQEPIASGESVSAIECIDFNHDGLLDLLAYFDSGALDSLQVYLNTGDGSFIETYLSHSSLLGPISSRNFPPVAVADFDGDLMPDFLLNVYVNGTQTRIRFFRNNLVSTNLLPPVPTQLSATLSQNAATLQWSIPQDSETTNSFPYIYNLRIGTTPGGGEIMSPMSHPVTGRRYIAQRGNAGQGGTWPVRDLPPGTYYWAVQSIDHSLNASPFAPEEAFTIAPDGRVPQLLAISITNLWHTLTIDGPVRRRVQIQRSIDLDSWQPDLDAIVYIGSEPTTVQLYGEGTSARFYRLKLE